MRIFLAGATGQLERSVRRTLLAQGHTVTALTPPAAAHSRRRGKVPQLTSEHLSRPGVRQARAMQPGVMIYLSHTGGGLGAKPRQGGVRPEIEVEALLDWASARGERINRFVFLSCLGARAEAELSHPRSLWAAEEKVRQSGIEYVILRPSWVFCPSDRSGIAVIRALRLLPVVPIVGDPAHRVQPVAFQNLVEGIVKAARVPLVTSREYSIGGPRIHTLDGVVAALGRAMGRRSVRSTYMTERTGRRFPWLSFSFRLIPPWITENVCNPIDYFRDFCIRPIHFEQELEASLRSSPPPPSSGSRNEQSRRFPDACGVATNDENRS